MPRYFFNIFNDEISLDDEGLDLRDPEAARGKALEGARGLVCESVHKGHLNLDHRIDVVDEAGARVLTVSFRDAFTLQGAGTPRTD